MPSLEDKSLRFQTAPMGKPPASSRLDGASAFACTFIRTWSELKWGGTVFRAFCPVPLFPGSY